MTAPPEPKTPSSRQPGFNYAVNGFRGVCVLLVFLFHIEEGSHAIVRMDSLGRGMAAIFSFMTSFRFGVEMFFMISGYVIIGSLRKHATVKSFFVDRALRIFPAWTPLHVMSFIIGPLMARGLFQNIDPTHWLLYFFTDLFFLPPVLLPFPMAYPMAWSLSYEWMFYVLAGACVFLSRGSLGQRISTLLVCAATIVLINLYPRALFFIPGVIMALYEGRLKAWACFLKYPLACMIIFLLAWSATGADRAELDTMLLEWLGDRRILFALLAFCAGTYMFACVVAGSGWFVRILCTAGLQFLGKISYSFYLWHIIVMFPVKRVAIAFISPEAGAWAAVFFFAIVSFPLSVWVSYLSWQYLEMRLSKSIKQSLGIQKRPAVLETQGS